MVVALACILSAFVLFCLFALVLVWLVVLMDRRRFYMEKKIDPIHVVKNVVAKKAVPSQTSETLANYPPTNASGDWM